MISHSLDGCLTLNRKLTSEDAEHEDAHRIYIGSDIELVAENLFWAHVGWSSNYGSIDC